MFYFLVCVPKEIKHYHMRCSLNSIVVLAHKHKEIKHYHMRCSLNSIVVLAHKHKEIKHYHMRCSLNSIVVLAHTQGNKTLQHALLTQFDRHTGP
jgi:hypothetical protein